MKRIVCVISVMAATKMPVEMIKYMCGSLDKNMSWTCCQRTTSDLTNTLPKNVPTASTRRYAASARPSPTVLVVDAKSGCVQAGPQMLTGGIYDPLSLCTTTSGWGLVLLGHQGGWGTTPRLAIVRWDAELNTNDVFAKRNSGQPDRLPVEDLSESLKPENARELNPGKGAIAFWQAAAFDGEHIIGASDYGWRDRRDANAITYVTGVNRVSLDGRAFGDPTSKVMIATQRADQAVANPALASGPDGRVLLLYEHDAAIDRQVIEATGHIEGDGSRSGSGA